MGEGEGGEEGRERGGLNIFEKIKDWGEKEGEGPVATSHNNKDVSE